MNITQSKYTMIILFASTFAIFTAGVATYVPNYSVLAVGTAGQQQNPDIKASTIYQTHTITLGNNIKNLVIAIPNEGHEDPNAKPKELRVVNQPYIPQNAVVNTGTTVTWFNADAGHHHQVTLVNNSSKNVVYQSGLFNNFLASKPIKFNDTGTFTYSGPSFDNGAPNYKMNGTVIVVNQPHITSFNTTTSNAMNNKTAPSLSTNIDTVSAIITPGKLLDKVVSDLKGQGFGIDNQYPFKSLRGGGSASGGDKNQVLLVLTSSGKNLNEVVSALSKITPTLPYR
jgi:plastocyanin